MPLLSSNKDCGGFDAEESQKERVLGLCLRTVLRVLHTHSFNTVPTRKREGTVGPQAATGSNYRRTPPLTGLLLPTGEVQRSWLPRSS